MFQPKTKSYTCEIGTFNMLQGVPFRSNLVNRIVADNDAAGISLGDGFSIIEGYMYDFIADGDSDIVDYIKERAGLSLPERFELFGLMVDVKYSRYIIDAYVTTRDDSHKAPPTDDDGEKKDDSQNLKKLSKEPSRVKT